MTSFEHALVGVDAALAAGLDRRFSWPIVAFAAVASVLPDWDGLTLFLGASMFADAHRVWGHNLLVAGLLGAVTAVLVYQGDVLPRIHRRLARRWPMLSTDTLTETTPKHSTGQLLAWIATGVIAAYVHLLADLVFSANSQLPVWGLPLLWPWNHTAWAYPLVPWGDIGTSVVLAAGMFAMVRYPKRRSIIAIGALAAVVLYIAVRGRFPM
jgi:hypothetical protein